MSSKEIIVVLDNIRSRENVGSIFRTADAFGVKKIYLAGYTPDPAPKTALGAEKYVEFERVKNTQKLIRELKEKKFFIISLEQSKNSVPLKKFKKHNSIALVLGNEVRGIPKSILQKSDAVVEIPMLGKKESLNVSTAAGIALYAIAVK